MPAAPEDGALGWIAEGFRAQAETKVEPTGRILKDLSLSKARLSVQELSVVCSAAGGSTPSILEYHMTTTLKAYITIYNSISYSIMMIM